MVAQECILGARHQKAHDVVADASEFLRLSLGEAGTRLALETRLVRLFLGHVAVPVRRLGFSFR